jgi:predicted nucleotidyltransferase component of viral defense system
MSLDYLHNHPDFPALIRIVAQERGIDPALVEKDYWIMHGLYCLQKLNMTFQLKGGTSLSKGYQIINRFSEDIDIRIEPPKERQLRTGKNHNKAKDVRARKQFFDWVAEQISCDGIEKVERDTAFDNHHMTSAGIRLSYKAETEGMAGLRPGVLLEAGFDEVSPNSAKDISSWVYDHAVAKKVPVIDNRAKAIPCYDPRYTFVEKLQTISTKFRQQQASKESPTGFMRHYYDLYSLLRRPEVQAFIGTDDYKAHKKKRFRPGDNPDLTQNQAFILADPATRETYAKAYEESSALYFGDKPTFEEILEEIGKWIDRL